MILAMVAIAAIGCVTMSSCGGGDDDGGESYKDRIVDIRPYMYGTWVDDNYGIVLTFNRDNTYEVTVPGSQTEGGTYTVELHKKWDDGKYATIYYSLEGDKAFVSDVYSYDNDHNGADISFQADKNTVKHWRSYNFTGLHFRRQ